MKEVIQTLTKTYHKSALQVKKNSPEILLAFGLIGFAGTVYLAIKSSKKVDKAVVKYEETIDNIELKKAFAFKHVIREDLEKDQKKAKTEAVKEIVSATAPAVAAGVASVGCLVLSYSILKKRYNATVAAFNAVSAAYALYRSRVKEEYGEQMDRHFLYGTKIEKVERTEVDENGKKHKIKEEVEIIEKGDEKHSVYSRWFGPGNPNFDPNGTFNTLFLKGQAAICNTKLHARGHLFLNEVYDLLGFQHTPEGAVVGWVEGGKDSFVDFGLFDPDLNRKKAEDGSILLDFNVDGVIWDLI